MFLFGIAAIIISVAVFVFSCASLCKALGLRVPEVRHELTDEVKYGLKTQAEANHPKGTVFTSVIPHKKANENIKKV